MINLSRTVLNTNKAINLIKKRIEEREKEIRIIVVPVLYQVGEELTNKIKEFVWYKFYKSYKESDRTNRLGEDGGFLGTITYKVDEKKLSLKIYCDWDRLYIGEDSNSYYFPHHIDTYTGELFVEDLYNYIYFGEWPYSLKPQAIKHGFKGLSEPLQKKVDKYMDEYLSKKIKLALQSHEINAKIVNKKISKK